MPVNLAVNSAIYGAAYGLLPIGWIVFTAMLLYRLAVETGKFEIIKDSIGHLTSEKYMQALVIAFAFGAFIEGASGFGSPVAVASAMLAGLGFAPFEAAAICLLANTAPVAFGAIGTPIVGLQSVTGLPIGDLSADVGRICAPLALIVPLYVIAVMGGKKGLKQAGLAALVCGAVFAVTQFLVSSYIGPYLTAILSSHLGHGCDGGDLRPSPETRATGPHRATSPGASFRRRDAAGLVALHFPGDLRAPAERRSDRAAETLRRSVAHRKTGRAEGVPESRHVGVRMAGLAQSGAENAAGGKSAGAVRGQLYLQPSDHQRHGRAVRRVRLRPRSARFAAQAGACASG